MYSERKNDKLVFDAIKAANSGHHNKAAALYQRAGNRYRSPSEKKELWAAAERSRRIRDSD